MQEAENRTTFSVERLVDEIEVLSNSNLGEGALLFLDEIQGQSAAIEILRYLYEERPDLPVIAAGSLLEVTIAKERFSMPVGRVEYYHLGPISFQEFLLALG